jgi:hypothetical protein
VKQNNSAILRVHQNKNAECLLKPQKLKLNHVVAGRKLETVIN